MTRLNAVLGSIVVTVGFWLMWGELPPLVTTVLALGIASLLSWLGTTVATVWAWTTLLLGVESLAWPVTTMVRIRMETAEPSDQQMGDMLTSVLFGLFSAIFWMTFSYGIFKLTRRGEAEGQASATPSREVDAGGRAGRKKRKRR